MPMKGSACKVRSLKEDKEEGFPAVCLCGVQVSAGTTGSKIQGNCKRCLNQRTYVLATYTIHKHNTGGSLTRVVKSTI